MRNSKTLKAKCKRTGKKFGIELALIDGEWRVVNIADLEPTLYSSLPSEVRQPHFSSHTNLLPCSFCGGRVLAGCSCVNVKKCTPDTPFSIDCLYCKELEIDYSPAIRSPYNACAGKSNIPGVNADKYGNPQGSQYDLARDGAYDGYTVVILCLGAAARKITLDDPINALKRKGFAVVEYRKVPEYSELQAVLAKKKTQLWILADKEPRLNARILNLIKSFFLSGNGVYFMGEEPPYFQDINPLIKSLFSAEMHGNNRGGRILNIQTEDGEPGIIPDHYITTGIVNFYEGTTISTVDVGQTLTPLIYSSNRQIVAAYYDEGGCRAIVDGGYTRLYCQWDTAGTDRYVVNAAAWLANFEKFG